MHALIIEVHPLIAMMLEDELRELGFDSFEIAVTQDEAIAAASRQRPDLITASVRLVNGCGIEAAKIIRSQHSIPTIYVVSNPEEAEEAVFGGIAVAKPPSKRELHKAVQQVTQRIDVERVLQAA